MNKTIADITYTELLAPWEVRDDLDIGILGVALPQNYLVHTSWVTRTQIFIALGLFISLVLLFGYSLANRISKPLESLAKASEEVSKGNFLVTLESPGSREVSVLNKSFNDMLKAWRLLKMNCLLRMTTALMAGHGLYPFEIMIQMNTVKEW